MRPYVKIASLSELAPGTGVVVMAPSDAVALFNVGGTIVALENWCLRCGSSLGTGTLDASYVTCSGCDWVYDVTTGAVRGIPALRVQAIEVKVVDGSVLIATPPEWPKRRR
jgi:nitrite reductase/ring-hydroxylating ferredoxin subunit